MLNGNLFDDPKDKEIARLKMAIEKFKEYDEERKKYYSEKLQRLGELESYVEEIESGTEIGKLRNTITELRNKVRQLSKVIQVYKIEETRSEEELSEVIANNELRKRNRRLSEQVGKLIKERSEWITKKLREEQR